MTNNELALTVAKSNVILAEKALMKYGDDRESAIKKVKELYVDRPYDFACADLKVILEVLGESI